MKGFRPGKQPKGMTKQALKRQMPEMNRAQERMVDLFMDKSPEEAKKILARWRRTALAAGIVLSLLAVLAGSWNLIAGVVVGLLAAIVFFAYLRMKAQRPQLEALADQVSRAKRGR
ncbi:MAG: hypothetical protein ACF8Q5_00455 [Phycisphaerales bacterium JB040]